MALDGSKLHAIDIKRFNMRTQMMFFTDDGQTVPEATVGVEFYEPYIPKKPSSYITNSGTR